MSRRDWNQCRQQNPAFKPGVGNPFTIMGRMNCGISLAGRKNNFILC